MGTDLYPSGSTASVSTAASSTNLWPVTSDGREIDLRAEFDGFLYGAGDEIAKGQAGILRRMRTDSDGKLIECHCVDDTTGEPDKDTPCPFCDGEGYLWDEEWVTFYKLEVSSNEGFVRKNTHEEAGIINVPYAFFYMEYTVDPNRYDKVVEVQRDLDGNLVYPYQRTAVHTIATAQPLRSDSGRIEYWRVACTMDAIMPRWKG
jgi:hypothetical protein